jgi:hypothetical protein
MVPLYTTYAATLHPGCATVSAVRFAGLIQTTSNAAVTFTVTKPAASVVRVFFRGQRLSLDAALTADTTSVVVETTGTGTPATCTSYHATSSNPAMDDFYIEVVGSGASVVTIATPVAVWGNHYLSQPVFSQTITT